MHVKPHDMICQHSNLPPRLSIVHSRQLKNTVESCWIELKERGTVMFGPGQGVSIASEVKGLRYEEGLFFIESRGSYAR